MATLESALQPELHLWLLITVPRNVRIPCLVRGGIESSDAIQSALGQLLVVLGPERTLFSTGMPFYYPDPAILKVQVMEAPAAAKEMILHRNAGRLMAR